MKKSILGEVFVLAITLLFLVQVETQEQPKEQSINGHDVNIFPTEGVDGQISRSQKIKIEERQKFNKIQQAVDVDTKFTDFLFTVYGVEEFLLNLPVTQQVAMNMFTYEMVGNAYMRPRDIENQPPIKVIIYENNNKIVHQSHFYFQSYIVFEGQQLSTYTIRFINSGGQKLISMRLKKLTESSHLQKIIDQSKILQHATKANRLLEQLKFLTNSFQRYTIINFQAVKTIMDNIKIYYYWNMAETSIAIVVCLVQVTIIRRICKQSSIV